MNSKFVPFDDVPDLVRGVIEKPGMIPDNIDRLYLVQDLYGKVRISVSGIVKRDEAATAALRKIAECLNEVLGAHSYSPEEAVLFPDAAVLKILDPDAQEIRPGVYWVDRLLTGRAWWTIDETGLSGQPARFTLFSVKGGVGRSTTAAVLAWHLARRGDRVLVVDLDLESPGLASALFDSSFQPEFGVTDWFVEDLVGQGDQMIEGMMATPEWVQKCEGDVRIVPAHGREPGAYLAKLGRAYMGIDCESWTARLKRLIALLENDFDPTVVLVESRSGLHDISAAAVTDLGAQVLLFAVDSESNWTGYEILFRHWQHHNLAVDVRERISIVSALTPELDTENYLRGFQERAWNLFAHVYDDVSPDAEPGDEFSFDLEDENAPHDPMVIHWNRGLAAGTSLRNLQETSVDLAYKVFFRQFDTLFPIKSGGNIR